MKEDAPATTAAASPKKNARDYATRCAAILRRIPGNATAAQHRRIVAGLTEIGPLTTQELQFELDIPRPGARISELRQQGASILSFRTTEATPAGIEHRFAKYFWAPGGAGEAA